MEKPTRDQLRIAKDNLDLNFGDLDLKTISSKFLKGLLEKPKYWRQLNESALTLMQSLPPKTSLLDSDKFDIQGDIK